MAKRNLSGFYRDDSSSVGLAAALLIAAIGVVLLLAGCVGPEPVEVPAYQGSAKLHWTCDVNGENCFLQPPIPVAAPPQVASAAPPDWPCDLCARSGFTDCRARCRNPQVVSDAPPRQQVGSTAPPTPPTSGAAHPGNFNCFTSTDRPPRLRLSITPNRELRVTGHD